MCQIIIFKCLLEKFNRFISIVKWQVLLLYNQSAFFFIFEVEHCFKGYAVKIFTVVKPN